MADPKAAGVDEAEWGKATSSCVPLRLREVVRETADACSLVFEIPESLAERFAYRPGQFLSFRIAYEGKVLTRSYSLSSSPHCDPAPKVTVKRVEDGRISHWINDHVSAGDTLMVVPPAGFFVLNDEERKIVLFSGGSGITPCISIIKSSLLTTSRELKLVYANRDEDSIIFKSELEDLQQRHADRFEIVHSLDRVEGFVDKEKIQRHVGQDLDADFYLCGPAEFMDTVEQALAALHIHEGQIHIERFISPPDPDIEEAAAAEPAESGEVVPDAIVVVLDGESHDIPYEAGERVLHAARRAGLDPPFSCEEGYCSCCMAKLTTGEVKMATNDCLTPELLAEGWVLTCQSRCVSRKVRIEYPD